MSCARYVYWAAICGMLTAPLLSYGDDVAAAVATIEKSAEESFLAKDTLQIGSESSDDAQQCLQELAWMPCEFEVRLVIPELEHHGEWLVRFPSARPTGDPVNDQVAMEWYQARDAQGEPVNAPAAVIVHESGRSMTVGRLIAKSLRSKGLHAFMLQLPYYGYRRGPNIQPEGAQIMEAMCQGIADARRARDAVAALPLIDAKRISLQGTSLGGFVTATTAGLDNAYHRVFVLLAGGDLHSVLTEGKKDAVKVKQAMLAGGVSDVDFRRMLNRIEPLRLAHRIDPNHLWLFSGRFDDVVPPRNSQLFAEAVGLNEEHHVQMFANHYSGILFLPMLSEQMSVLMRE